MSAAFKPIMEPFATHVFTPKSIPYEVEKLTKIISYRKKNSVLKHAPKPIEAITNFVKWINARKEEKNAKEVILYGHNLRRYDLKLLITEADRQGIDLIEMLMNAGVTGFIDTLEVIRILC